MRYDDRTLTGVLLFFGSAQFLIVMLVAEGSLPSYSVSSQVISDLGVGPTASLFNTSVIVLGLVTLASAFFFHRIHKALWITVPFYLAGIGSIGFGLFPETVLGAHAVFALLAFVFGNLVAILVSLRLRAPLRWISLLLGIAGLVALALFANFQYAGIGVGGMERLIVYPVLFWGAVLGGALMSAQEPLLVAPTKPAAD
jgi:hypothetical membrane protein